MADEPDATASQASSTEPVRDEDVIDELPEDLNASEYVGPYVFPNNNRRRIPGYLYLLTGAACIAAWAATGQGDGVLVNGGFLGAGVLLVLIGVRTWDDYMPYGACLCAGAILVLLIP